MFERALAQALQNASHIDVELAELVAVREGLLSDLLDGPGELEGADAASVEREVADDAEPARERYFCELLAVFEGRVLDSF